jgi:signal transduction histidine kinase/ActR/RegA family two-component response regulator
VFRTTNSWEGRYQKKLGVQWGSNLVAGKFSGYCSKLFGVNCWAEQKKSFAAGDEFDEFFVSPSPRSLEVELEKLLVADGATRADMAVALERLRAEVQSRQAIERELRAVQTELEERVLRAVAQLRLSEQRFADVIQALPMGVHLYRLTNDDQLRFEGANPAADTVLGIENEQFIGMTLEEAFPALTTTEIPTEYREVCKTGNPFRKERLSFHSDPIDGCFDVHAFRTGSGTMAALFHDVTAQIRAEREREALRDSLNRSRRMEALGLLAGGVAHDLNNILTGLTGYPEMLLAELGENSPHREMVETIMHAGLRAAEVVKDLLTVARGVAVVHKTIDLNELITNLVQTPEVLRLTERYPHIRLISELDAQVPCVLGSVSHLRKAIVNLVVNGMEAIEGTGRITIRTFRRKLETTLPAWPDVMPGEFVSVVVEDSGGGISAHDIERIFEPFYSRKALGHSGTGIGLTIVWTIIQEHRGFIEVSSEPGATKFAIYVPATQSTKRSQNDPIRPITVDTSGKRILVVDDEPIPRDTATRMLHRLGFQVHAVQSGEEALAFLEKNTVDAILLDMVMPGGIDGQETYKRMAALSVPPPTLLVSGHSENDAVQTAQALGAGPLLEKPFRLAQLEEELTALLTRHPVTRND